MESGNQCNKQMGKKNMQNSMWSFILRSLVSTHGVPLPYIFKYQLLPLFHLPFVCPGATETKQKNGWSLQTQVKFLFSNRFHVLSQLRDHWKDAEARGHFNQSCHHENTCGNFIPQGITSLWTFLYMSLLPWVYSDWLLESYTIF